MDYDTVTGVANRQERLDAYVAGYVDGEGSFHVAIQRNKSTRVGWQLVPEFHVSQAAERRQVLDVLRQRLSCGRIQENHRGTKDTTLVFVVRKRRDLLERVVPFFEQQPLLSVKQQEVETFATIVKAMADGQHLSWGGFVRLRALALSMNGGGRYRRVHGHPDSLGDHVGAPGPEGTGEVIVRPLRPNPGQAESDLAGRSHEPGRGAAALRQSQSVAEGVTVPGGDPT